MTITYRTIRDTKGYYAEPLTEVIGMGAYDALGHMNEKFLEAKAIGTYPKAC
jgi:hypothetical protein